MAEVRPFRCVLPARGLASRVAALPYDVYSRSEAAVQAAKDRLSFLNIDRPETQFGPEQDMYAPEVYQKADALLRERMAEGVYVQDSADCYYLYELTRNGKSQTGLVACVSIDDYVSGVIRRHENTRADKEADRIRHVDACSAQTGPIFLTYHRNGGITSVTDQVRAGEPLFAFVSEDGIRHRGWRIENREEIRIIREAFAQTDRIYLADGHHRAASAVRVGLKRRQEHGGCDGSEEFNYFLSVLFPEDELTILDYNRVVRDLNGLRPEEFLKRVSEAFEIAPLDGGQHPAEKGCMSLYLAGEASGRWYALRLRNACEDCGPVERLDVSVLQNHLLAPVLGIANPKEDERIRFVGGVRGLEELERLVDEEGYAAAFAMYPTSMQELLAVADAGRLMPPKSTWFEPKLRSGLFLHLFER